MIVAGRDKVGAAVVLDAFVRALTCLLLPPAAEDENGTCTGHKRATLCVSSQVGCQMGCTFCATGTMGLIADLSAGEIIEQLVHARSFRPIRNIVFMVRLGSPREKVCKANMKSCFP